MGIWYEKVNKSRFHARSGARRFVLHGLANPRGPNPRVWSVREMPLDIAAQDTRYLSSGHRNVRAALAWLEQWLDRQPQ